MLGRQPLWTGVGISIVAFYFALVYFLRLARSELGDEEQAVTAVMLLAAYPFAVFFSAAYTESLFLLTLVGAVYHFRQNQLWRSAFWGFVCGLTRPPGCFLSIVLGLMAVAPDVGRRALARRSSPAAQSGWWPNIGRRLLAASAPGLGMLTFSAFVYQLTGNPFQWTMQNQAWGRVYRGLDSIVSTVSTSSPTTVSITTPPRKPSTSFIRSPCCSRWWRWCRCIDGSACPMRCSSS